MAKWSMISVAALPEKLRSKKLHTLYTVYRLYSVYCM